MRIWLGRGVLPNGRKHMNVGIHFYEDEGVEVRRVIKVIQGSLEQHFPDAEIIRARAVRKLFGERE
jgi:hypothetical protein